jgi:hypothetical protein
MKKKNPHCPVPGCRATQPHLKNKQHQEIYAAFTNPTLLAQTVKSCIVDIVQSCIDDVNRTRFFAYLSRWRLPEEMYTRALYLLFVATPEEIAHVVSDELPNSFSAMWRKVNAAVFDGKSPLEKKLTGLRGEEFTTMDTLNHSAHGSLIAVVTTLGFQKNPNRVQLSDRHLAVWKKYCDFLDYAEKKFGEGKSRAEVLVGFKHLLARPSTWPPKQPARENS